MKKLFTFLFALALFNNSLFTQEWITNLSENNKDNYFEIQKSFNNYLKDKPIAKGQGYKQFKRLEYFYNDRLMPDGSAPDLLNIKKEWNQYKQNHKSKNDNPMATADWKFIGPSVRPTGSGIGRVNCVFVDPNDDNIVYAGAAFGGLWKSTNAGANWTSLIDDEFQSIGVSSVAISKSNSNIIYAVTGDADAAGIFGSTWCYSIGLIKSTDAGASWSVTNLSNTIVQQRVIYKVIVNPENANLIYVAAENGLFRSSDAGKTFTTITPSPCRDIIHHATNPQVVYGAFLNSSNYYEFRVYNESTQTLTVKEGVPGSARIALAVSPVEPNSCWAVAATYSTGFNSIWKTADGGGKWTKLCDNTNTVNILSPYTNGSGTSAQSVYDLCIAVSPTNASLVFVGGINMWKSTTSGSKWTCASDWTGSSLTYLHADLHSFDFNSSGILFCGNDGGVTKSSNSGTSWINISDGLGISQFYKISTAKLNGNTIVGGTQDNGTFLRTNTTWDFIQPGDGMQAVIDQNDANSIYASFYGNDGVINFTKSTNAGQTFTVMINRSVTNESSNWVAPIVINPTNSNIIFVGYQNIWKSTNKGVSWVKSSSAFSGVVKAITICKSNANIMYATNGTNVYQSTNAGSTWTGIYSSSNPVITNIMVDPINGSKLYITYGGYAATKKVTILEDGVTTNITGTLPNVPVNCITLQDNSPNRLYIGTDVGVFTIDDNTSDWAAFNTNLPTVVVLDLNIHNGSGLLRAATYARGIWETKVNNCNLASPAVTVTGDTTFCTGDSVILESATNFNSYAWSNGEKTKKIIVKTSGKYSVTVTDASGCTASSRDYTISSNIIPEMKITSSTTSFCDGDSLALSASLGFANYSWSNGGSGRKIYITAPGKYTVNGTTGAGCTNSANITVTMNPKPAKPGITINGDVLQSTVTATSYKWYLNGVVINGATSITYKMSANGKYKVEIFDANGCKNISDEINYSPGTVELESDNEYFRISPNPSEGEFYIHLKDNFVINNLELFNQFGEKQSPVIQNFDSNIKIDLKSSPTGIYFVRFMNSGKLYIVKIIKN
jgi:photosystem II stability/assembly factor-like uncharacterized protein